MKESREMNTKLVCFVANIWGNVVRDLGPIREEMRKSTQLKGENKSNCLRGI